MIKTHNFVYRLWQDVTKNLKFGSIDKATEAKHGVSLLNAYNVKELAANLIETDFLRFFFVHLYVQTEGHITRENHVHSVKKSQIYHKRSQK